MKKLVLLAMLVVSQIAFAGPKLAAEAAKPLTLEQARRANVERKEIKEYMDAAKAGKIAGKVKEALIKLLTDSTSHIGGLDSSNLELLASTRPEILDKMTQLISLSKNGTAEQKEKASSDLKILNEAAKYELTSEVVENLEKITEMSDYNQAAKEFKAELIKVLRLGKAKSIAEAVKIASNGKITLEKIKECII